MVQRLIVPVDGSDSSWRAVDVALSLARRTTSSIHIVEIVFSPIDTANAHTRLEEGVAQIDMSGVEFDVEVLISDGTVASAIDDAVTASPGSTIVIASHGRGRSAALVGSITEDIVQRTFGPIIVVGPHVDVDDFSGPIIVTVDGSDESEAALPLAAAWGIELGVEPWIVNVIGAGDGMSSSDDEVRGIYAARLAHDLSKRSGHSVEFEELYEGHPAVAVPEFAERMKASLIVASSHGRSGLSRLTLGSVTSGFIRHSTCPVLIVRLPHPAKRWDDVDARAWAM
jgi:nucleotide-binding universal stress UspA family protein